MVSRELLGQLKPLTPPEGRSEAQGRRWSNELQPHEHVDRSVDGYDMRAVTTEPRVDLWHRERHSTVGEDVQDGPPRAGQPQPSTSEDVRQRLSDGDGCSRTHTQLTCIYLAS